MCISTTTHLRVQRLVARPHLLRQQPAQRLGDGRVGSRGGPLAHQPLVQLLRLRPRADLGVPQAENARSVTEGSQGTVDQPLVQLLRLRPRAHLQAPLGNIWTNDCCRPRICASQPIPGAPHRSRTFDPAPPAPFFTPDVRPALPNALHLNPTHAHTPPTHRPTPRCSCSVLANPPPAARPAAPAAGCAAGPAPAPSPPPPPPGPTQTGSPTRP